MRAQQVRGVKVAVYRGAPEDLPTMIIEGVSQPTIAIQATLYMVWSREFTPTLEVVRL